MACAFGCGRWLAVGVCAPAGAIRNATKAIPSNGDLPMVCLLIEETFSIDGLDAHR
jgi:hypothetical protein